MNACLICGAEYRPWIDAIRDWEYEVPWSARLVMCAGCGLVAQDPPVAPAEIAGLYPADYTAHTVASRSGSLYGRVKAWLNRRSAQAVARYVPPGGRLLEVGCGNGAFLATVAEVRPDLRLSGVDIVDLGVRDIPGFEFHLGQLEQLDLGPRRFDVIYASNLIEHVPDPRLFLERCAALLAPGGRVVGVTPDHRSLDRLLFGRYWAGYHYPRHTFVFDHRNLRRLLGRCGFVVERIAGSYGFWYLSFANRLVRRHGPLPRGLPFAAVSALALPLDLALNLFTCHGSMTFVARRAGGDQAAGPSAP
jgi:SAM-dependent methyltransferase